MNESEYRDAKNAMLAAVRRGENEVAMAIRRLIVYFYKGRV